MNGISVGDVDATRHGVQIQRLLIELNVTMNAEQ